MMTQMILTLCTIGQLLFTKYFVVFKLWWEMRELRKTGIDVHKREYVEEQAKFADYRTQEQIECMTQLMVSLGYVLLFGAVAPIMVPFAFSNFWVTLRGFSQIMTSHFKRAVPRAQRGIGAWGDVLGLFQKVGLLLTAVLFVMYGRAFRGANLLTQLTGTLAFCLVGFLFWALVDIFHTQIDPDTLILTRRRTHTKRIIDHHVADQMQDEVKQFTPETGEVRPDQKPVLEALKGNWEAIPQFKLAVDGDGDFF